VKDTKFERTQHEATGRHQGNLKRFLRGIQNDHEKDEREKQRAKSEVERLNKAVGGASTSSAQGNPHNVRRPAPASASQTTIADRKRQVAQLAEMGVAVPVEFRGEMALAGDWQVLSQKPAELGQENDSEASLSVGIRKRKFEGQEEEEEAGETVKKKGWGSTTKEYPSSPPKALDALLAGSIPVKKEEKVPTIKQEDSDQFTANEQVCYDAQVKHDALDIVDTPQVEQEDVSGLSPPSDMVSEPTETAVPDSFEVLFKKRKSKTARQN
jgi:hypothetical protein